MKTRYKMKRIASILIMIACAFSLSAQLRAVKAPNGKWGFANKQSKWEIQPQFEELDINNQFGSKKFASVKINGKWGCIDETGQYVTQPVLDNKKLAGMAGKEWQAGKMATKCLYEAFSARDRKWGLVNCRGNYEVKPIYDAIDNEYTFTAGKEYSIVQRMGYWGCLNKEGYYIIKPYFVSKEDVRAALEESKAMTQLGDNIYTAADPDQKRFGFVNYLGNWVIKPMFIGYDKGYTFSDHRVFAVVKYTSGWGCVNRLGKFIVKPTYQNQDAAKKAGFQWQATYKENIDVNTLSNIDDGKHKECQLTSGGSRILANGGGNNGYGNSNQSPSATGGKAPTLKIINPKSGSTYSSANVTIDYEAHTSDGSTAKILAYVNGELIQTKGVQRVAKQLTLTLPRVPGATTHVQLIAKDASGRNSDPAVISLKYVGAEGKPGLHILAVGVSDYDQSDLKLQNAAKDAQDFVATIKSMNINSQYENLSSVNILTDKMATDKNIKKALSTLNAKVNQGDVILLFFSGHGAKEEGSTYFLSVNAESNDLFSSSVNFDEIRSATRRLLDKKCKIVLFMDACHSGALYGQKSTAESFALAEPGVVGFYSSTENQKSNESEKWANGIFTKSLLEGLKGKAADAQGDITLDHLEKYIRESVRKATNGAQMPIFENKMGNYVLFRK